MKHKKPTILVLILVLVVIGVFAYINLVNQPANKFYSGEWRLGGTLFAVNHSNTTTKVA